jgi:hypothetical protein
MINFISGLMIGGLIGVMLIALVIAGDEEDK